ncbi:MAG TPA: TonB-dependent receptor [Nevskia sp.]|nr:TonB-dependent receptor [Nevskia sp.]
MRGLLALRLFCGLACAGGLGAVLADDAPAAGNPATVLELPQVDVIANVPLPGLGVPRNQMPANVQTAVSRDLQRQQILGLSDFLNGNFSGVNVNDTQDNPFQADVNYHGFTASPLLGAPEGLSVYQDGVRVNESFGDTVNWDLIPENAISTITLVPGSNPVFGLNTLGGALAVRTKSGHDDAGAELQASGGSFGRRDFQAQAGGDLGQFDWFLAGNYFDEDGWRDLSPSHVRQLFGKLGWQDDKSDVDLSYTWADTRLVGNGTTPESLLAVRREAIFSAPDATGNHLNFANLTATRFLAGHLLLSGNAYYRQLQTRTINGSTNGDYSGGPSGVSDDCSGAASLDDFAACAAGINQASDLVQRTLGFGAQLTESHDVAGWNNQAVLGISLDRTRDQFSQSQQYADVTAERSTSVIDNPANPLQAVNSLYGTNQIFGVYFTDTLSPSKLLHLVASARYNRNAEVLGGFTVDDDGDRHPITVDHSFHRLNPALGFTVTPSETLTLFADYNEGSRTPTVIELGCADPAVPCSLPNDFASDPDLQQVVARNVEAGARGALGRWLNWSMDIFHTRSSNDIQFVSTSLSQGYFSNVGDTRRQGLDLGLGGRLARLKWHLAYSFVDASYRSPFEINAVANSSADADGNITIQPGDRIPLIPRHTGRLVLDYAATEKWNVGANLILSSGSYLRGNENNANQAGASNGAGKTVQGSGRIGGYAVLNLDTDYRVRRNVELFLRVVNVFDRDYATAGTLTTNPFSPGGSFRPDPAGWTQENAVSPAQPRAAWGGVRISWN